MNERPQALQKLRDYAVAIYGRTGVSSSCLHLQDNAQVDVNVLLFAAWAASHGLALAGSDIQAAKSSIDLWHTEIVRPLRVVRKRLKQGPAPAPSDSTSELRKKIQSVEIAAELIELDELEAFSRRLKVRPTEPRDRLDTIVEAVSLVVAEAAGRQLRPDETAAIVQIAESCSAYSAQ